MNAFTIISAIFQIISGVIIIYDFYINHKQK
jgi:hypothetical protein